MSFDLSPVEYLDIVRAEHDDYLKYRGSIRRAMS